MTADPLAVIRDGHLPEKVIPVCLALDLVDEYEALQAQLAGAKERDSDSLAGGAAVELQHQLDALQARMLDATIEFRLRALPRPVFRDLKRAHPPRKGDDGATVPRDALLDVNEDTFFEPLLRASIAEPVLDEETFRLLVDERLSDPQYEALTGAAWLLNVRRIDLPFSYAASKTNRNSEPG